MSRRYVSIFSILILSSVVLFQFQNCAPATSPSSSSSGGSNQVHLIEDFNKAQIQFASNEIQLHDDVAQADVTGLCNRDHNGAPLRWTVWGGANGPMLSGDSICQNGQFLAHLTGLNQVVCGVSHQLVIEGDWGASAYTKFSVRCQPVASESTPAPANSPFGTQCELEYQPGSDPSCTQVCYRQQQVVSLQPVESSSCSQLVDRLAGP